MKLNGSNRYEESARKGQKIRCEGMPDRSSHIVNEMDALKGREMGGGPTNVSHSLSSAGNVPEAPAQRGTRKNYGKDKGTVRDNNYRKS